LLLHNKYELIASEEDAYNFVIEVASSQMDFDKIAGWIEQHSSKI
jgi:prophage maintenance system killer protein